MEDFMLIMDEDVEGEFVINETKPLGELHCIQTSDPNVVDFVDDKGIVWGHGNLAAVVRAKRI